MRRAASSIAALLVLAGVFPVAGSAQLDFTPAPKAKSYVAYTADPQTVRAGKSGVLLLHFHVMEGFHVNSHTPKSELLVPTDLKVDAAEGVKPGALVYPQGTLYSFSFEPTEKLDVYQGDFIVKLPVVAAVGGHTLSGTLHYQACDDSACYAPRSLPVQVAFTAK